MSELDAILAKAKKQFGDHVVRVASKVDLVERIPTGIFQFDLATGGGVPRGRVTVLYGAESSGKTTVALKLIAYVQRVLKRKAVYVDLEATYDPQWAAKFGVDTDALVVLQPDTAEQAVDLIEAVMYAEDMGIVVVDSLAAMVTENEINSEAGKMIVGGASLMVGKMIRKVTSAISTEGKREHRPAVVLINQTRFKVGVLFGDPEIMPGGQSPKFAASMIIRLYGKNKLVKEVHEGLPTFKETSCILKKWKVPVVNANFEYDLCMIPHGELSIGEAPSWNTVSNYLKQHNLLVNNGKGWDCLGAKFKTLGEIQARYTQDADVRAALQLEVIRKEMQHMLAPQGPNGEDMGIIEVPNE